MKRLILAAGYLGLMGVYFYGWQEDVTVSEPWGWLALAGLAALQLAAGVALGSWRALGLPFAAILVAAPFGYGERHRAGGADLTLLRVDLGDSGRGTRRRRCRGAKDPGTPALE